MLKGWPSKRGKFVHKQVNAREMWPEQRGSHSNEWPLKEGVLFRGILKTIMIP